MRVAGGAETHPTAARFSKDKPGGVGGHRPGQKRKLIMMTTQALHDRYRRINAACEQFLGRPIGEVDPADIDFDGTGRMRADLARQDTVEEIGPVSFETAQGGGGIACWPDVYIGLAIVHVTIDAPICGSPGRRRGPSGPHHAFGRGRLCAWSMTRAPSAQ